MNKVMLRMRPIVLAATSTVARSSVEVPMSEVDIARDRLSSKVSIFPQNFDAVQKVPHPVTSGATYGHFNTMVVLELPIHSLC
mmetsp:Transcript_23526/g.43500  ORF Transcript_23526/g.43500 Transcript_23526/m.43500 type:complete len:83 (+) Transcript_23526:455-703(+)